MNPVSISRQIYENIFDTHLPKDSSGSGSIIATDYSSTDHRMKDPILHRIAGPPYDLSSVVLPTESTTIRPKM